MTTPSTSFSSGVDVGMVGLDTRDISMPPPSRLSFRMCSSMTPQPFQHALPQRHISEPSPLSVFKSSLCTPSSAGEGGYGYPCTRSYIGDTDGVCSECE
jgi:hypothetical protein